MRGEDGGGNLRFQISNCGFRAAKDVNKSGCNVGMGWGLILLAVGGAGRDMMAE